MDGVDGPGHASRRWVDVAYCVNRAHFECVRALGQTRVRGGRDTRRERSAVQAALERGACLVGGEGEAGRGRGDEPGWPARDVGTRRDGIARGQRYDELRREACVLA